MSGTWRRRLVLLTVVACLLAGRSFVDAFTTTPLGHHARIVPTIATLHASSSGSGEGSIPSSKNEKSSNSILRRLRQAVHMPKFATPIALGLLSAAAMDHRPIFSFQPKAAFASAPVMAPPRRDVIDPETEAMFDVTKRIQKKNEEEMKEFQRKAREIADTQGEKARIKYEKEWEAARRERAEEKTKALEALKRELLDQGICPFVDLEGQRQVLKIEKDVDLAEVPGTKFYMERDFEKNQYKRSMKYQKQAHRFIIKSMVEDMKKKGRDPLVYFEKNQKKTIDILNMSTKKAIVIAEQYRENIEKYGQLTKPKPGEEVPVVQEEKLDPKEQAARAKLEAKEAKERAKAEAKLKAAEAKAAAKAEKEKLREEARQKKEQARAEKERLREEARQKKEEAKKAKIDAKTAAAAAAAAAASSLASGVSSATEAVGSAVDTVESAIGADAGESSAVFDGSPETLGDEKSLEQVTAKEPKETKVDQKKTNRKIPAAAVVVAAGGGGFAIKVLRERSARDEAERQRQFKLLMGEATKDKKLDGDKIDAIETVAMDLGDESLLGEEHSALEDVTETDEDAELPDAPTKKKRGIRGMFSKRNANDRETDLNVLIGQDANAPEFALLLAKILAFGAPGRFPRVMSLPGGMPMQEFDLELAKEKLSESLATAEITNVEAAEIFANVVNCMLIDIVDLASSSLKEDDKVTVDAINIVVDYMNHAASLYDAVAQDVVITPVTYGGTLAKSKLEQMYSTYAVSGMMSMDETFNARVGLLQDVFGITEKKAEGLMTKALQKNMWKMMKDGGEGMEGMEEMLSAMGGAEGLEGLGALGGLNGEDGPSPEQLKEMLLTLKTMKDSGTIPPDELDAVRAQFREAFGSSIEDVMKDADEESDALGETDKELLDLMKSILDD